MSNLLNSIVKKISFDFVKNSKITCFISTLFVIGSILLFIMSGVNLGVDFTGGQIFEITSLELPFNLEKIRNELEAKQIKEATVQYLNDKNEIIIKLKGKEEAHKIKEIFFSQKVDYKKIDYVGPQVSSELIFKGVISIGVALIGMFFYLLFRFNWYFALSGIIGLIHDVALSIGLFVVTKMEFNIPSVAAILTIIGYSINDSVVIFDRIREYSNKKTKSGFSELINQAIHSTLVRTILTSFTTMLAALPLVIIGRGMLHDFSLVILFGVFVGTYSSIFVAGPLLRFWHK